MKPVTISEQGSFTAGVYNGVNDPKQFFRQHFARLRSIGQIMGDGFQNQPSLTLLPRSLTTNFGLTISEWDNGQIFMTTLLFLVTKNLCGNFPTEQKVIVDAMIAVFEKSGEGILITHSAGGDPGWTTAIKSNKVKGVIALEPRIFPFPKVELPAVEETTSPFPAVGQEVSREEFMQLTNIANLMADWLKSKNLDK